VTPVALGKQYADIIDPRAVNRCGLTVSVDCGSRHHQQAFCFLLGWSTSGNPASLRRFGRRPLSLGEYDAAVTEQSESVLQYGSCVLNMLERRVVERGVI